MAGYEGTQARAPTTGTGATPTSDPGGDTGTASAGASAPNNC